MFIEITRINQKGEQKKNLVDIEDISSVIELTQEPKKLYDEEGNVVDIQEPTEELYLVSTKSGKTFKVNEQTYEDLKKILCK